MPITLDGTNGISTPDVTTTDIELTGSSITGGGNLRPQVTISVSPTSGSSVDVTDIPSWARSLTVLVTGLTVITSTADFSIQLGTSGGIVTTGYACRATRVSGTTTLTAATSTSSFLFSWGGNTTDAHFGRATISLVTGTTWLFNSNSLNTTTGDRFQIGIGALALGGTLDRIRVNASAGTFSSGTITVMYE